MGWISLALNLFGPAISKVLDKSVTDKDQKEQIEKEIQLAILSQGGEFNRQAGDIILAEAKSEHWITATWRPLLMMVIVFIVAWNYAFVPVVAAFGANLLVLDLPDQLWTLLTVGVGGYTVGRSAEKSMQMYTKSKTKLDDY